MHNFVEMYGFGWNFELKRGSKELVNELGDLSVFIRRHGYIRGDGDYHLMQTGEALVG